MNTVRKLLRKTANALGAWRRWRHKPADWLLYKLDGHPPSEFYAEIFTDALAGEELHFVSDEECSRTNIARTTPFVYIGHGTPDGAFSSVGYTAGLRDMLCDPTRADSFIGSPHIWWACYSALWLERSQREDWFGYKTLIGADPRAGQERWWREHLTNLVKSVVDASRGREPQIQPHSVAKEMHADALRQYYSTRGVSWVSVLCARAFASGADWRKNFGSEART